ncbi:Uncharacterised protein [Bordetella pertussis]|nr:Uncharacterised protein [Bordetella pertussis]
MTSGPMMNWPWSSTAWMRGLMVSRSAWYWVFRSMNCMSHSPSRQTPFSRI